MITDADEQAIRPSRKTHGDRHRPDGSIEDDKDTAEITRLMTRRRELAGGLRWIARRVKPSRRHMKT